jgi:hypothetical protein
MTDDTDDDASDATVELSQAELMEVALDAQQRGVELGLRVALSAVDDALMRAEFPAMALLNRRIDFGVRRRLLNTPFAIATRGPIAGKGEDENEEDS